MLRYFPWYLFLFDWTSMQFILLYCDMLVIWRTWCFHMFPYVSRHVGCLLDLLKDVKICEARCHILSLPWRQGAHRLSAGPGSVAQHTAICGEPRAVGYHFGQAMAMEMLMGKAQQMLKRCATERLLEIGNRKRGLSKTNMKQLHLFTSLYISLSLSSCFSLFFDFGFLNVSEQSSLKVDKFDGVSRVFMWSWSALCSAGSCSQERQHMYLESSRVVLKA